MLRAIVMPDLCPMKPRQVWGMTGDEAYTAAVPFPVTVVPAGLLDG